MSSLHRLLTRALGRAACVACNGELETGFGFCEACRPTLERCPRRSPASFALDGTDVVAPFLFGGALAQAIVKMKYAGRDDLLEPLAGMLELAAPTLVALRISVVVPVPLHPIRLAERGFNQSSELGRRLARRARVEFSPCALRRHVRTLPQAGLDRREREENVRSVFSAHLPEKLAGRRVAVVDDVATTGATLRAAARAAFDAGASSVLAVALARAPREDAGPAMSRAWPFRDAQSDPSRRACEKV